MRKPNRGIINNAFFTKNRQKKASNLFIGREQMTNVEVYDGEQGEDGKTLLFLKEKK